MKLFYGLDGCCKWIQFAGWEGGHIYFNCFLFLFIKVVCKLSVGNWSLVLHFNVAYQQHLWSIDNYLMFFCVFFWSIDQLGGSKCILDLNQSLGDFFKPLYLYLLRPQIMACDFFAFISNETIKQVGNVVDHHSFMHKSKQKMTIHFLWKRSFHLGWLNIWFVTLSRIFQTTINNPGVITFFIWITKYFWDTPFSKVISPGITITKSYWEQPVKNGKDVT